MPNPAPFVSHRPGTHWVKDVGKLYRFTSDSICVIRPWPAPQAWQKHGGGPWHPAAPPIDLVTPQAQPGAYRGRGHGYLSRVAEQKAWEQIPDEIRSCVTRAHIAGRQWPALSMFARCPGAQELAETVPALAAALSVGNRIRPVPVHWLLRSVRSLLEVPDGWRRWQRICRWLDLDDSRSFIRMLRRFDMAPYAWPLDRFKAITRTWATPHGRKLLQHTPVINEEIGRVFAIATRSNTLSSITPRLVAETLDLGDRSGVAMTLQDVHRMWQTAWDDRPIPRIQSVQILERIRAETIERAVERIQEHARTRLQAMDVLPFPPPPLYPAKMMTPLTSPEALRDEGRILKHCIGNGSWAQLARRRLGYAYGVNMVGHRATVWIRRDRRSESGFRVEQIRGPRNYPPSKALMDYIDRWIQDHAAWAQHRLHGAPKPNTIPRPPLPSVWTEPPATPAVEEALLYGDDEIPF